MKTGPGLDVHITKRTALLLLLDIIATYLSYWLASILTNVKGEVFVNNEIYFVLGILAFINVVVLATFRLYNNLWEYASIDEVIQIVGATVLGTLGGAVFLWIIGTRLPIRVFVVSCFLLIFFMGGIRFVFRFMRQKGRAIASSQRTCDRPRTLVVGAGETGSLAIGRMASKDPLMPGIPIVATDDDPAKRGQRIHGVKVSGGTPDIVDLVDRYDIEQIVVAIPSSTPEERKRIYGECTKTDCRLRTLPNVRALSLDEIGDVSLRDVDVADLLGREEIVLNTRAVSGYIAGETVLVTGGGGSIGSELCRQLCTVAPARIVIFDIYENDAYMLRNELLSEYDDIDIIIEIGNVCDKERVNEVFAKYRPGAVFHAAAHKHVPLMETSPNEAVKNNVFGTWKTAYAAAMNGTKRFVMISTDKAVNPTNIMGASKRICEMIIQTFNKHFDTEFVAVRFGNVLGSNGSVIPLFKKQIMEGGPVTVTHPDIIRYFMTIPEAVSLVLQAGAYAKGGEIFVLDMGKPVKILDLARNLIKLSGYRVGEDIKIEFTGLRPGEKLYEELLMEEEGLKETDNKMIYIGKPIELDETEFFVQLKKLKEESRDESNDIRALVKEIVPTYHYADSSSIISIGRTPDMK